MAGSYKPLIEEYKISAKEMIEFERKTREEADATAAKRKAGFEELSKQCVDSRVPLRGEKLMAIRFAERRSTSKSSRRSSARRRRRKRLRRLQAERVETVRSSAPLRIGCR